MSGAAVFIVFLTVLVSGFAWSLPRTGSAHTTESPHPDQDDPGARVERLLVIPGWRVEQITGELRAAGLPLAEEFAKLVADPVGSAIDAHARRVIPDLGVTVRSLEGYLAPGTYAIRDDDSAEELVIEMLERFSTIYTEPLQERAGELGLSVHEVVTLASIVEREVRYVSEASTVAGVYLNRLQVGMPLESDPTASYARDSAILAADEAPQFWLNPTSADLRIPSPYNTYVNDGLPPGPIASPGQEALWAVLYPAPSDYLFFLSRRDGGTVFSRTFAEHDSRVDEHLRFPERSPSNRGDDEPLQRLVRDAVSLIDGHVGVFVQHLETGESATINPDDRFTSASLYKLYVMASAFELREEGARSFDEPVTLSPVALAQDPASRIERLGSSPTLGHTVSEMIVVSSNAAGGTLLNDEIGRDAVGAFVLKYGLTDSWLGGPRLVTTPRDVARFLALLSRGELVSGSASAEMMELLGRQEVRDRLPRYLPGVRIAHKTGSLNYRSHDAGIIMSETGPVAVVIMTEGAADRDLATESIARLGRVIFDYFSHYGRARGYAAKGDIGCFTTLASAGAGELSGVSIAIHPSGPRAGSPDELPDRALAIRFARDVTARLAALLQERGAEVHLSRCDPHALSEFDKAAVVNRIGPDAYLEIEFELMTEDGEPGLSLAYASAPGRTLARYVMGTFAIPGLWDSLIETDGAPIRNFGAQRETTFSSLTYIAVPAARTTAPLGVGGATQERRDLAGVEGEARRDAFATGHLDGLLNYFRGLMGGEGSRVAAVQPAPNGP
jgi:UPF0755 protein